MSTNNRKLNQAKINNEQSKADLYRIFSLLFIIGIVPLIVAIKIVFLSDIEKISLGTEPKLDIFSFYKMIFLLLFTTAGLLIYLFKRNSDTLEADKKIYYIPAGIYALFVFLSAAASQYKNIAFGGYFERYEGAFVIIAYIVIMFLSMNLVTEERTIKLVLVCLLGSSAIISIVGIMQYFGIDPVNGLAMLTAPEYAKVKLSSAMNSKLIFSTLYNSNYVGSYMAMLLPVALLFFIWVKRPIHKAALAILLCFITFNWIACDSRAGIVGGIIALLIVGAMYRKTILRYKLIVASIVVLLCGGLVITNLATNGSVVDRLKRITSITTKDGTMGNPAAFDSAFKGLEDVSMNKDRAKIVTDKGILQIVLQNNGEIKLIDNDNKELAFSLDKSSISIGDERFSNIKLLNKPQDGTMIVYYNAYRLIDIEFTKDGLMSTYNRWMSYRNDKEIEKFGFEGIESFGSNRGYIWSRTIPLLKSTILLGHGPDTFPMYFPQYDYLGKLKNYQTGGIFIDKSHNYYLQTAVNTGIVSLLALLALFGIYLVASIKIYIKEEFSTFKPIAGLACFAAFCGYILSGFFNDSVISVAPVFWILFGTGIGINISLVKDKIKNIPAKQPGKVAVATGKKNH